MDGQIYDHVLVVKDKKRLLPAASTDLYIGPWIAFLNRRASDIARKTGINEGYLSQLISGKKRNASFDHIKRIADELGIPIDALRHPPPDRQQRDQVNPWPLLYSFFASHRPDNDK